VFMVARLSPLFEQSPDAQTFVLVIGATTAFFAATVGLVQNDIKRVIAYSTCSQLGYMFVAMGVGAYSAGMFHLFTHAFFKALLFLGAGSVIHAMHHEQDMRRMGGLGRLIPFTAAMMAIGTLALTGFPFTAGFYSKDAIIEAAFTHGYGDHGRAAGVYAFLMVIIAAGVTSFYSWRLFFMTFMGTPRASAETLSHVHESPRVMTVPLALLAVGALVAGAAFHEVFIGHHFEHFWKGAIYLAPTNKILEELHHVPGWVQASPFIMMVGGFLLAVWFYLLNPGLPARIAANNGLAYRFLLNKWYFDELYDLLFVRSAKWLGRFLWKQGDGRVIDGFGPDGIALGVMALMRRATALQTGFVYHYAFAMMLGVAGFFTYFMFGGVR
jgi:NADH-quinone oxidoreductase subunit L